jgi:hypothetical protein
MADSLLPRSPLSARSDGRRSAAVPRSAKFHRRRGGLISLLVHLVAIAVAASWTWPPIPDAVSTIDAVWSEPVDSDQTVDLTMLDERPTSTPDGGAAGGMIPTSELIDAEDRKLVVCDPAVTPLVLPRRGTLSTLTELSAPVATSPGTGSGAGEGTGAGFFGLDPERTGSVVFVVDSSRSMNHPHDSPSKTRYRRLKLELIRCIMEMSASQSFYVIFFSSETQPMPATGLQPADPRHREPYLRWIAGMNSGGAPTDPLPALDLALRLRPATICFLTDGEFDQRIQRRLTALQQSTTAIHTFAFGEPAAAELLQTVASRNGGEYRFVP